MELAGWFFISFIKMPSWFTYTTWRAVSSTTVRSKGGVGLNQCPEPMRWSAPMFRSKLFSSYPSRFHRSMVSGQPPQV